MDRMRYHHGTNIARMCYLFCYHAYHIIERTLRLFSNGETKGKANEMATAATKVQMTWQERALSLMEEKRKQHGGINWQNTRIVAWYPDGTPAEITMEVESLSTPDRHFVHYFVHEDSARCDCVAGSYTRPCCHAGVAIWYGRAVTAAYTHAAKTRASYGARRDVAAEDNARVMGY